MAGTPILIDINPDGDSAPSDFVQVGNNTFFVADDGISGRELWVTDGTTEGTRLVHDIVQGTSSSEPRELTNLNGILIFVANDGINGEELWRSDGTSSGTVIVRDLNAGEGYQYPNGYGPFQSFPREITELNGQVFFRAEDADDGSELWSSNGTQSGSALVKDISPGTFDNQYGTYPNSSNPDQLVSVGNTIFFVADDGVTGRELWKTDGTEAGTVQVLDLFPGSSPYYYDGTYYELYPNASNPGNLTAADGKLFFTAEDGTNGRELWISDGTATGTTLVKDIFEGGDSAFVETDAIVELNNGVMFSANDGSRGAELWRSDGTDSGTFLVKDISAGSIGSLSQVEFVNANGTIFFAADDNIAGEELWKSDGSESGTVRVSDIESGPDGSYPYELTSVEGSVFFAAFTDADGIELWESDGTESGTTIVDDIVPGSGNSTPKDLFNFDGTLLFSANDETNGRELWAVDTAIQPDQLDARITIFVNSDPVDIPEGIGIDSSGNFLSQITTGQNGTLTIQPIADESLDTMTLDDFFDTWRTSAGAPGNNSNSILNDAQLLGNFTDQTNTIQMFVNGVVSIELENYEIRDGDEIILAFGDNPVISLNTNFGALVFELFEDDTPITVDNFLTYANDGRYIDSFFHRSVPGFVIQGGGFATTSNTFSSTTQFSSIRTDPTIQNEPLISNVRGTVAMAKLGSDPNSATSQFFVNLSDDNTFLDSPENNSFTVFAQVLDMTSSDRIAALPVETGNPSPYGELPLSSNNQLVVIESIEGQGTIAGSYFVDANGNGSKDTGEQGIPLPNIYIDSNNNDVLDPGEQTATPNADGDFLFQVKPGAYVVRLDQLDGTVVTVPSGGNSYNVTVGIGRETTNIDFGEAALSAPTSIDLVATSDTGVANDDDLTNLNNSSSTSALEFLVSGVADGAEVRIYAAGNLIGSGIATGTDITVTTNGNATITDGSVPITATQVVNGSESDASPSISVTIDTLAPAAITTEAPTLAEINQLLTLDVQSPNEGAGVLYSLSNAPTGMSINGSSGVLSWTPTNQQAVPQEFEILVSDAAGNTNAQSVDLTVLGDIPALPDNYSTTEDTPLTIDAANGVLLNDGDSASGVLIASIVGQPSSGTISFNADGSFEYTPNVNFFGSDSFTYSATDNVEDTNVAKVRINVIGTNDPTTTTADAYSTLEDTVLNVDASSGVLANDSDPDSDNLVATLVASPANGTLKLNGDGSFEYVPNLDFSGTDSFTYAVNDGDDVTDPVTVSLAISNVNDAPTAVADSYTATEDQTLTINVAQGVLANDLDPDSDLTAVISTQPANGTVSLNSNGSFTFTPNGNFFGSDSFSYVATDGTLSSAVTNVSISVNGQPDPPTAVGDTFNAANDGTAQKLGVLANDSADPDGVQTLTLTNVTQGTAGGTVSINGDSIDYEAALGFVGRDTFTYSVTDSDGLTGTATVEVNVLDAGSSSVSGFVFLDLNRDGAREFREGGVPGALITLSGTTVFGDPFNATTISSDNGFYEFRGLSSGTYQVSQQQPNALNDGQEKADAVGVTVGNDQFTNIVLSGGRSLSGNNFAEESVKPEFISIAWFFASTTTERVLRQAVATAEELAGNFNLAATIRNGDTQLPENTNDAPIATADSYTINSGTVLNVGVGDGVLANDSDPDGDPLTVAVRNLPSNGALELDADGSFIYTPNGGFIGVDTFTYAATDIFSVSSRSQVTINVVNDSNVFSVPENSPIGTSVGFLTSDESPVVFDIENLDAVEEIKLRPDDHFDDGRNQDNIVATAPVVLIEYLSFQCSVCAAFHPIVEGLQEEFEDDLLVVRRHLPLESNFPNARAAARASEAADRQSAFNEMGDLLFTRQSEWAGLSVSAAETVFEGYAVELGLNLSQFQSDVADPAIDLRIQRDSQIAQSVGAAGTPTFFVNGVRISNPADLDDFEIVIQDALDQVDEAFSIDRLTGEVLVRDSSALDFDTNPSFTLVVNATDLDGQTTSMDVVINITSVNEAPVAVADSFSLIEDNVLSIDVANGILSNDSGSGTLTAQLLTSTTNGVLDFNSNGSFIYTPNANFSGTDSFTYKTSNGTLNSVSVVVSITVSAINDSPTAQNDAFTVAAGSGLVIDANSGVLANDSDLDGDDLTASAIAGTTRGALILNNDGSFSYTPGTNFVGTDSFTYQANDGSLSSNIATVTFTVTEGNSNNAPVAVSDVFTTVQDETLVVPASGILANDTDADGDTLFARLLNTTTSGTLSLAADGSFTYTPNSGFVGDDFFTYQSDDNTIFSNVGTVTITVEPANHVPFAANDSYATDAGNSLIVSSEVGVLLNDSDADSDPLTAEIVSATTNGTITLHNDGSFEYLPQADFFGSDSFSYTASDGKGSSNVGQVSIIVNETAAESVSLQAIQDTSLFEDASGNTANGAGEYLFVGRTDQTNDFLRRGLIQFDIASQVPDNVTITKVTLRLNMSRTVVDQSDVQLFTALSEWGEGSSNASGQEGEGSSSTTDDATWIHTFSNDEFWSTPGGDYDTSVRAVTTVDDVGVYEWSSAKMITDVQMWLDDPDSNFGWIMLGDESQQSAKRFDSRENSTEANRPQLIIEYEEENSQVNTLGLAEGEHDYRSTIAATQAVDEVFSMTHDWHSA